MILINDNSLMTIFFFLIKNYNNCIRNKDIKDKKYQE